MNNQIVSIPDMPKLKDIINTPIDDLKMLYNQCVMMEEVCKAEKGVGLSAIQIGIPWRLFVAIQDAKDTSKFRYLIDCKYAPVGEETIKTVEGCLSLRRSNGEIRRFKVNRYKKIRLVGKELLAVDKLKLVDVDETHEDDLSIVYQHEIDHHLGILISDVGEEIHIWS